MNRNNIAGYSGTEANRNCVASGELSTGAVFAAIVAFIVMCGPVLQVLILENVYAICKKGKSGRSNLDSVATLLIGIGWFCCVYHLQPRDFGTPASRPRIWLICFRCTILVSKGVTEASFKDHLDVCLDAMSGSALTPMQDYLLPEGHPYITTRFTPVLYANLCQSMPQRVAYDGCGGLQWFASSPAFSAHGPKLGSEMAHRRNSEFRNVNVKRRKTKTIDFNNSHPIRRPH